MRSSNIFDARNQAHAEKHLNTAEMMLAYPERFFPEDTDPEIALRCVVGELQRALVCIAMLTTLDPDRVVTQVQEMMNDARKNS